MKNYEVTCCCFGHRVESEKAIRSIDCVTKQKRIDCEECFCKEEK